MPAAPPPPSSASSTADWDDLSSSTASLVIAPSESAASLSNADAASPDEDQDKDEDEDEEAGSLPAQQSLAASISTKVRVLSAADVKAALDSLPLDALLASQARAFQLHSSSTPSSSADASAPASETPHRTTLQLPGHTTLIMPSRAPALGGAACKIVSVPAEGVPGGLPAGTVLLDEATGRVKALVSAGELTGVRTAAGSAVASRWLLGGDEQAGRERKRLVVFGSGTQAFWHAHLHLLLFPSLTHLTILARPSSTPTARLLALLARLEEQHPALSLSHSSSPNFDRGQAVHNADVIICCTPSEGELFGDTQPRRGTHLVLVGSYKPGMREVSPSLLQTRALGHKVYVDGAAACRAEAGELQPPSSSSSSSSGDGGGEQAFTWELVEIGAVLDGPSPCALGKDEHGGDMTVFKSVGLGVQDVAITALVFDEAFKQGLGVEVDF